MHELGCGVEISCPRIVAEALPGMQDVVFRCARECGEIGEAAEPVIIIRQGRGDLCLLEHELGDEDGVRIASASPRKIAAVFSIPAQENASERARIFQL